MNNNYISDRAVIDESVIFGRMVNIFGETVIKSNVILEDFVTIGHPSPKELNYTKERSNSLQQFYDSFVNAKTYLGENSIVRSNTVIYSGCTIKRCFDCGHNVVIRENCSIAKKVYILPNTQIKSEVKIENNCRIAGTICDRTIIGKYSSVLGHTVHEYLIGVGGFKEPAPTIGIGVTIGREAVVVGDVYIDDFVVVGANSVVTDNLLKKAVYAGIPARRIRNRTDDEMNILKDKIFNEEEK